jgi:hypothetical protein
MRLVTCTYLAHRTLCAVHTVQCLWFSHIGLKTCFLILSLYVFVYVLYVYTSFLPPNYLSSTYLSLCPSVYLSIHLSSVSLSHYHLSIHTSNQISICLSICSSIYPSVCPSIHPSIHHYVSVSLYLFVSIYSLSTHLYFYFFVYPSIYLRISLCLHTTCSSSTR